MNGNLRIGDYFSFCPNQFVNNGTIEVFSNVQLLTAGYAGSAEIVLKGNASGQTITGAGSSTTNQHFPAIRIDAGANEVSLAGWILTENWYVDSVGTLNAGSSNLRFRCRSSASSCRDGALNVKAGTEVYNNVFFEGDRSSINLQGTTVRVLGTTTIGDVFSTGQINNGTIEARGDFVVSQQGSQGTAQVRIAGGAPTQTFSNSSARGMPAGNWSVDKSAGVFSLSHALSLTRTGQNLSLVSGTINMSGLSLAVNATLTLESGTVINRGGGSLTYTTLTNNGGTINP